jgi:hypothetical protein
MSLAPLHLAIAAALVANVPAGSMPHKMLPRIGQESAPRTRPAKGGTFTVKSTGGATIATVSIKGGTGGNPATMVVTLQPATAGAATPAAINAAAQVVTECVTGASTFVKFGPFVKGRAMKVVSYIQYQQIGVGFGFLVTNNGVSGCTKLPSTMMSQAPSAKSTHVPPGSYGNNCPSAHMQGKILVASCLGPSPGGGMDTTAQTQIDPASCHGRDIVDTKGRLACGPPGSHPPV